MIAASAVHAYRDTLYSEDMQHGMSLEYRLRIANPFRGGGKGRSEPDTGVVLRNPNARALRATIQKNLNEAGR